MRVHVPAEEDELIKGKPIPFRSNFHYVDGYRMHYLDEGQGPVVILLHGNPTWCFYFRNLVQALKGSFRVIVPDYIGCGLSSNPNNVSFRALDRVRHLQSLVDELKIEKFSLVMHDWGGSIGTGLALANISKLEKLVYLNTTVSETESLPKIIRLAAKPYIGKYLTKYSKRFLKLTTDFGVYKRLPKDVRDGYFYPYRNARRRNSIWQFVSDIPFDSSHPSYSLMLDIGTRLPELSKVPVQIVWGMKDPCFHREMLNKLARHFPQARILEIPQASHLVLEDASELACSTIDQFLKSDGVKLLAESEFKPGRDASGESQANALYSAFCRAAERAPSSDAAIEPLFLGDTVRYQHMKYEDLSQLVHKYQRGLHELGLRRGDRVIMLVPAGIEFLALSLAVMARGAVPVFIDPGMGRENLFACIEEISPQALIGSVKAQLLRIIKKKLFAGLRFHVVASGWFPFGGPNLSFLKKFTARSLEPASSGGVCMIAFTSGATGKPKGVVYTDKMVSAQLEILARDFGLEAGKKDLPLLAIFSLFHVAGGVCSVFPPMNASQPLALDPARIEKIILDLGINYSFGSPTLWNKIAEYCIRTGTNLPSLERVFMAGAPVPQKTLIQTAKVAPRAAIYTPYGATEALPVTLVNSQEILNLNPEPAISGEYGTYVGKAVSGLEMKIIESVDGELNTLSDATVLPPFQIGEVIVKGNNVSTGYWDRPDATKLSKIYEGDVIWHRMGDMGYLDGNGGLYFCGRKAHVVRCRGKIFYSVPLESIFNTHHKVRRAALVSLFDGRDVGLAVEPFPEFWPESYDQRQNFKEELLKMAKSSPLTDSIEKIYFHPSFPVDARHNAKIYRDKLGQWASAEESELDSAA